MIGKIAVFLIVVSSVVSFFTGKTAELSAAILNGGDGAVKFCISTCGAVAFFSGIMNIAAESGLTEKISKMILPFVRLIIPSVSDPEIAGAVTENIVSNLFGLGNAATPAGLRAVKLMFEKNGPERPDRSIASFVVMNTASLSFFPTTVIALRNTYGSLSPFSVIGKVIFVQFFSCAASLISVSVLFRNKSPKKLERGVSSRIFRPF